MSRGISWKEELELIGPDGSIEKRKGIDNEKQVPNNTELQLPSLLDLNLDFGLRDFEFPNENNEEEINDPDTLTTSSEEEENNEPIPIALQVSNAKNPFEEETKRTSYRGSNDSLSILEQLRDQLERVSNSEVKVDEIKQVKEQLTMLQEKGELEKLIRY
jgi:hypothetical protein